MALYRNGGYIGFSAPTTSDDNGTGVWTLDDYFNANKAGAWPQYIPPDPYWTSVVYLARFDNNLTDQKGQLTPTTNGAVGYTTTRKFGTHSLAKISGANFLTLAGNNNTQFAFGTGDFTVEYWIQFPGNPANNNNFGGLVANNSTNGTPGGAWSIYQGVTASSAWKVGWYNGNAVAVLQHSALLTPGQWHHVAYSRVSGVMYVAVNGTVENKGSYTQNISTPAGSRLGTNAYSEYNYTAYFDEVRVTKGVGRYTANFNPPTTRHPNY